MKFVPPNYKNKRVALLGLGLTGGSLIKHLKSFGIDPICWDDDETKRNAFIGEGLLIEDLNTPNIWKDLDLLIISPGIPFLYPEPHPVVTLARQNAVHITTDIELFFDFLHEKYTDEGALRPTVICVTGSNGKSTTTALIHHILSGMSKDTEMGGNIGKPVMSLNLENPRSIKVIELSSYQIEIAGGLEPDVAIFLNLSNDHLLRHGGLGGYFLTKSKLFHQGNPKFSIVGVDENEGKCLAASLEARKDPISPVIQISIMGPILGADWSVFISNEFIVEIKSGEEIFKSVLQEVLQIPGDHNKQNACAAYAACRALGFSPKNSFEQIRGFKGLPHRTAVVKSLDGIIFINDSKATNVDSVRKSLKTFDNIRWIAGGLKKDGDIIDFNAYFSRIKKAYLIGSAATEFASSLTGLEYEICGELEMAVRSAYEEADEGDTVLLAPGCASFDQFKNFEDRGNKFCKLVENLKRKSLSKY